MIARAPRATVVALALACAGCADVLYRAAIPFVYRAAPLPADRIVLDVAYADGPAAAADKHRLDLFRAAGTGWPVMVFVHGGNWTSGDRGLRVGGADVYRNIGRFYAAHGLGVAVISYRLQPAVGWRQQVDDVARAVAWVHREIGRYGGDPDAIFLAGHSAGGQLVTRVALDPEPLRQAGVPARAICGLIPASALGLDLADEETYALGADPAFYAARFRDGDETGAWRDTASTLRFARRDAPPALVLSADGDPPPLRRQSVLLDRALAAAGAASRLLVVPGQSHASMVLALSRPDRVAAPAVLDFVRTTACPRRAGVESR